MADTDNCDYRDKDSLLENYVTGNPIVQVVVIMDGGAGAHNAGKSWDKLSYDWPGGNSSLAVTNRILFKSAGVYCCAGLLFAWFAKIASAELSSDMAVVDYFSLLLTTAG